METPGISAYNIKVMIDAGSNMDDVQEQYVNSVLDKLEAFVEDVWQTGINDNMDEAWILTALLHSSAQIAAAVTVMSSDSNQETAMESSKHVIKFITNHVVSNVKEGVLN